jgi:hypothetical protein
LARSPGPQEEGGGEGASCERGEGKLVTDEKLPMDQDGKGLSKALLRKVLLRITVDRTVEVQKEGSMKRAILLLTPWPEC